jgi:hypothetical protein
VNHSAHELRAWLHGVRRAWRRSHAWLAIARAAAGLALFAWAGWIVWRALDLAGGPLVLLTAVLVIVGGVFAARMLWPLRQSPSELQIARFVEERCPELGDLLVTASEQLGHPKSGPLDGLIVRAATARAAAIDRPRILDPRVSRKRAAMALAALAVLTAALVMWRIPGWRAFQTARMFVAPPVLTLNVTPGDARTEAGKPLAIAARLDGLLEGVAPQPATLHLTIGGRERTVKMGQQGASYKVDVPVERDFTYRVVTDRIASRAFSVKALHPAQVERIDIEYEYPKFTGLKPRVDENSGDIFGPAGTKVKVRIKSNKPVTGGALSMRGGTSVPLADTSAGAAGSRQLETSFTLDQDAAYRVTLQDVDGLTNVDGTEYFIRLLNDRPPDVRVMRPGSDRQVTRLEEIVIEARADDDYGVSALDLVYAVRGGPERVIPLHKKARPAAGQEVPDQTNVTGAHTIYVEEMDVQPGDFITYYARARDIPRGKQSSESRSDIFFLEVRPFSEEFVAAQSQAMMAGGSGGASDLLEAQKEIIVATWKVQRRSEAGKSEQDIRAIAKAQTELKGRAEQMAAMSLAMQSRRRRGSPAPQTTPAAENPIALAAESMGRAAQALEGLKPDAAIPHEMRAYNHLLRAQAENNRTQVARQRGNGGGGGRTGTQDLSALFDRELMRQQETNYETRSTVEQREEKSQDSALDKIRELARRQDDLARQQRELARQRGSLEQEEMKRRLERLTKEQEELRREAQQLAQQMGTPNGSQQSSSQSGQQQGQPGSQGQQGQQASSAGSQSGLQQAPGGQPGSQQQGGQQAGSDAMQQAVGAMGDAAKNLARADLTQAQSDVERTLEQLRDLERRLRGAQPDERRRAVGELQVEAQQMAEAQQRLSAESRRLQQQGSPASGDALRRMATEQDRLADRVSSLRRGLSELSAGAGQEGTSLAAAQDEIARQKLDDRMRQGASALRDAGTKNGGASSSQMGPLATQQEALARAMAQVAQKMGSSVAGNAEARKLSDQLAQVRDQKSKLDETASRLEELARQQEKAARAGAQGKAGANGAEGRQGQSGSAASQQAQGSRGQQSGQGGRQSGGAQGQAGGDSNSPGGELGRLQAEYDRQLRQTRELMDSLRDQTGQNAQGDSGPGGRGTPMHHEFSRSAPGTEAFKQDYAKWDILRKDVALALEQVESSLARKLTEREAKDRLNAGGDDRAPAEYAESVSRYYRSLARRPPK